MRRLSAVMIVILGLALAGCARDAARAASVAGSKASPPATAGAPKPSQGAGSSASGNSSAAAKHVAATPAGTPKTATADVPIGRIQSAPPKTYAIFDLPKGFMRAEYELVVRPYGWTPAEKDQKVRRLLVVIDEAKGLSGQTDKIVDLNGKNALIWIDEHTEGADALKRGGSFRMHAIVRPSRGTGFLYATSVSRSN